MSINIYNMDVPLSDSDIKRLCYPQPVRVITYDQLNDYDSIEHLFEGCPNIALLYRYTPTFGHWIALLKYNDLVEIFDSLGRLPDEELTWLNDSENAQLGQHVPTMSALLLEWLNDNKKHKVWYNEIAVQGEESNTCGRYVAYRIKNRHILPHKFQADIKHLDDDDIIELTGGGVRKAKKRARTRPLIENNNLRVNQTKVKVKNKPITQRVTVNINDAKQKKAKRKASTRRPRQPLKPLMPQLQPHQRQAYQMQPFHSSAPVNVTVTNAQPPVPPQAQHIIHNNNQRPLPIPPMQGHQPQPPPPDLPAGLDQLRELHDGLVNAMQEAREQQQQQFNAHREDMIRNLAQQDRQVLDNLLPRIEAMMRDAQTKNTEEEQQRAAQLRQELVQAQQERDAAIREEFAHNRAMQQEHAGAIGAQMQATRSMLQEAVGLRDHIIAQGQKTQDQMAGMMHDFRQIEEAAHAARGAHQQQLLSLQDRQLGMMQHMEQMQHKLSSFLAELPTLIQRVQDALAQGNAQQIQSSFEQLQIAQQQIKETYALMEGMEQHQRALVKLGLKPQPDTGDYPPSSHAGPAPPPTAHPHGFYPPTAQPLPVSPFGTATSQVTQMTQDVFMPEEAIEEDTGEPVTNAKRQWVKGTRSARMKYINWLVRKHKFSKDQAKATATARYNDHGLTGLHIPSEEEEGVRDMED